MCNKQWTKKALARLKVLHNLGESASRCALILCAEKLVPAKTTRNAVIGAMHRHGISARQVKKPVRKPIGGDPNFVGCQWPHGDVGDDDFGFCGAGRHTGYSYCTAHCHQAYTDFDETLGVKKND